MVEKKNEGLHPTGWSPVGWSPVGWSPLLGPDQFLELAKTVPVIDVRAPKEFRQGHIPGAVNIPLFDDDERAIVGTTYAKKGKEEALLKGLGIAGRKLVDFVEQAQGSATNKELLVHCWRGGMRSEAMAWLFSFAGIKTSVLQGGYRAYRRYIRHSLSQGPPVIVIGGMTGSGKTELLHHLLNSGEQVLDLEGLANHKGSAFGALGQEEQPTNEQFENDLAQQWLALDPKKPVWIEDESRNIGKVIIPEPVFTRMADARVVFIDVPFEERVKRLVEEYGRFNPEDLVSLIEKIMKRLGREMANSAVQSIQNSDLENAISIVLNYYDKTYRYGISRRDTSKIKTVSFAEFHRGFAEIRGEIKT